MSLSYWPHAPCPELAGRSNAQHEIHTRQWEEAKNRRLFPLSQYAQFFLSPFLISFSLFHFFTPYILPHSSCPFLLFVICHKEFSLCLLLSRGLTHFLPVNFDPTASVRVRRSQRAMFSVYFPCGSRSGLSSRCNSLLLHRGLIKQPWVLV